MTTRLRLFAYHVIGAVSMCGTLLVVAPPLAPSAVGFSVVYLAMLAVLYTAGRLVGMDRRHSAIRWAGYAWGCAVLWVAMSAIQLDAGVVALGLSLVSLWPRRITVRGRGPRVPASIDAA